MKQNSSLLSTEERPGVLQRNTVSNMPENEGIAALGLSFNTFYGLSYCLYQEVRSGWPSVCYLSYYTYIMYVFV